MSDNTVIFLVFQRKYLIKKMERIDKWFTRIIGTPSELPDVNKGIHFLLPVLNVLIFFYPLFDRKIFFIAEMFFFFPQNLKKIVFVYVI